jgi:hypothetical protein
MLIFLRQETADLNYNNLSLIISPYSAKKFHQSLQVVFQGLFVNKSWEEENGI